MISIRPIKSGSLSKGISNRLFRVFTTRAVEEVSWAIYTTQVVQTVGPQGNALSRVRVDDIEAIEPIRSD